MHFVDRVSGTQEENLFFKNDDCPQYSIYILPLLTPQVSYAPDDGCRTEVLDLSILALRIGLSLAGSHFESHFVERIFFILV